jgi:hypothetical protein
VDAGEQVEAQVSFGGEKAKKFPVETVTHGDRQRSQRETDQQSSTRRSASAWLR